MDRRRLCVLCRTRPVDARWRPFCSKRCQVADQAKWADGTYCVEGPAAVRPDAAFDHDLLTDHGDDRTDG